MNEKLIALFVAEATLCKALHKNAKATAAHISYGQNLNRMSKIIRLVAGEENPVTVFEMERSCELFYLENFVQNLKEQERSREALKTMEYVQKAIEAPKDFEQYRENTEKTFGEKEMKRLKKAPSDIVHGFVKSQNQRLARFSASEMLTPPEKDFFDARREALKIALKQHERNCQAALGFESSSKGIER